MQTGLEGKPWFYGVAAGLVVAGAIYFGANIWLLKPQREELGRQESELAGPQAKIQAVDEKARQLAALKEALETLVRSCDRGDVKRECPILEALEDGSRAEA